MEMYDYLAWVILGVFYILAGVPMVGSVATDAHSGYSRDWQAGLVIHATLGSFVFVVACVLWAFIRVST